jgi:hypothetical protein
MITNCTAEGGRRLSKSAAASVKAVEFCVEIQSYNPPCTVTANQYIVNY